MPVSREHVARSKSLQRALDILERERETLRGELERARDQRRKAQLDERRALKDIGDLAYDAVQAGIPASQIIELTDVSRRTLYKLLRERGLEPRE